MPYINVLRSCSERLVSPRIMNLDTENQGYELIASIGAITFLAHLFLVIKLQKVNPGNKTQSLNRGLTTSPGSLGSLKMRCITKP